MNAIDTMDTTNSGDLVKIIRVQENLPSGCRPGVMETTNSQLSQLNKCVGNFVSSTLTKHLSDTVCMFTNYLIVSELPATPQNTCFFQVTPQLKQLFVKIRLLKTKTSVS